jgi:hypothetical protein
VTTAFDPALHSDPEVKLVPGWLDVTAATTAGDPSAPRV